MCSVLLLHQLLPDSPLAVIFVRDEDLDRGGGPPEIRQDAPRVLAPRDPLAGGTWFGASGQGFLAGLVNRRGDPVPEDGRSRGLLLLDALRETDAGTALSRAAAEAGSRAHGGCRLFAGDARRLGWVDLPVSGHASPVHWLEPGGWLMRHSHHPDALPDLLLPVPAESAAAWLDRAYDLVSDHQPAAAPLCTHHATHGSVDATLASLGADGRPLVFRHAQGAPCSSDPEDCSGLLASL